MTEEQALARGGHVTDIPALGWSEPADRPALPEAALATLTAVIGEPDPVPATAVDEIELPPSRLDADAVRALAAVVGEQHVLTDWEPRLARAAGRSYVDLLRLRAGEVADAPDAVVLPDDHDEVVDVLRVCADRGIAVSTFGGGTSVVGGVTALRGPNSAAISLDLRRLDRLVAVDGDSMLVTVEPGIRGPRLEEMLAEHSLTLGHFPQSFVYSTVGGWVATRSAGQASTGFGRIDHRVVGLTVATPTGTLRLGGHPGSAAGPDLVQLFVGSEGVLGVITSITLRVYPKPAAAHYEGWVFRTFEDGVAALRELAQRGLGPDVSRLSDVEETRANLALSGTDRRQRQALDTYLRLRKVGPDPCMAILGWLGTQAGVSARHETAAEALHRHGGLRIGRRPGESWDRHRYEGPVLRDALLDRGILVETMETATTWSNIDHLYRTVRGALAEALAGGGTPAYVMCHVSHLYATGASLYFTVLARQVDGPLAERVLQWETAKDAAMRALQGAGGTITHHHAVGTDHAPYLAGEIGDLGVAVLRAVKDRLDPAGILNPGKLIP